MSCASYIKAKHLVIIIIALSLKYSNNLGYNCSFHLCNCQKRVCLFCMNCESSVFSAIGCVRIQRLPVSAQSQWSLDRGQLPLGWGQLPSVNRFPSHIPGPDWSSYHPGSWLGSITSWGSFTLSHYWSNKSWCTYTLTHYYMNTKW